MERPGFQPPQRGVGEGVEAADGQAGGAASAPRPRIPSANGEVRLQLPLRERGGAASAPRPRTEGHAFRAPCPRTSGCSPRGSVGLGHGGVVGRPQGTPGCVSTARTGELRARVPSSSAASGARCPGSAEGGGTLLRRSRDGGDVCRSGEFELPWGESGRAAAIRRNLPTRVAARSQDLGLAGILRCSASASGRQGHASTTQQWHHSSTAAESLRRGGGGGAVPGKRFRTHVVDLGDGGSPVLRVCGGVPAYP